MEKVILIVFIFLSSFLISQKDSLVKIDSAILIDKGNLYSKWKVELLPNGKFVNRSRLGVEFNVFYNLTKRININYTSDFQYFYDYFGELMNTSLYNFTISSDILIFKKEKLKRALYSKKFYDDSLDVLYRPKFKVVNVRKTFVKVGINRFTFLENFTPSDNLVIEDFNATSYTFDKKFDKQTNGFDLDGFLNEMKEIKRINYYNIVIGLKHTKHYNYSFSIRNQKVIQKADHEIYANFIYGLFSNFRTNNSSLKQEIKLNSTFSRIGFNAGIKNTIRMKKNSNAIVLKYELTIMPTLLFKKNVYLSKIIEENNYMLKENYDEADYFVYNNSENEVNPEIFWSFDNSFITNNHSNRKIVYLQVSIGYSFGEKY